MPDVFFLPSAASEHVPATWFSFSELALQTRPHLLHHSANAMQHSHELTSIY